jgi:hypothetical protein
LLDRFVAWDSESRLSDALGHWLCCCSRINNDYSVPLLRGRCCAANGSKRAAGETPHQSAATNRQGDPIFSAGGTRSAAG